MTGAHVPVPNARPVHSEPQRDPSLVHREPMYARVIDVAMASGRLAVDVGALLSVRGELSINGSD